MESIDALVKIVDLGSTGILVAILYALWRSFNEQNKFIREMLIRGEEDRKQLTQLVEINRKRITRIEREDQAIADSKRGA